MKSKKNFLKGKRSYRIRMCILKRVKPLKRVFERLPLALKPH